MKRLLASPRLAGALVALLGSMAFAAEGPVPSEKVVEAYSQYVCFVLFEVASGTPEEQRQCEKEAGQALVAAYPSIPAEERQLLEKMPAEWTQLRKEWSKLDEAQKDMMRMEWAMMLQAQMESDTAVGGAGQPEEP